VIYIYIYIYIFIMGHLLILNKLAYRPIITVIFTDILFCFVFCYQALVNFLIKCF